MSDVVDNIQFGKNLSWYHFSIYQFLAQLLLNFWFFQNRLFSGPRKLMTKGVFPTTYTLSLRSLEIVGNKYYSKCAYTAHYMYSRAYSLRSTCIDTKAQIWSYERKVFKTVISKIKAYFSFWKKKTFRRLPCKLHFLSKHFSTIHFSTTKISWCVVRIFF